MNQTISDLLQSDLTPRVDSSLSLVKPTRQDFQNWLSGLSMLNVGDTARQLYVTLRELAQLPLDEHQRFELLELMRPAIQTISVSLSKHYINQNLLLDERAEKIASLAQQLQAYPAVIYRHIARVLAHVLELQHFNLFNMNKKKAQNQIIALATLRSISDLTNLLYEAQSLYLPPPVGLWKSLYELYEFACKNELQHLALVDEHQPQDSRPTIEHAFLKALILGTCNTNKLRQVEIKRLYQVTDLWVDLVGISSQPTGHDLFLLDPKEDLPPVYITKAVKPGSDTYYLDTRLLLSHFENLASSEPKLRHRSEGSLITGSLKYHLILTYSAPLERSYARHAYDAQIEISLGLIGAHYQLSEGKTFEAIIGMENTLSVGGVARLSTDNFDINYSPKDEQLKVDATREQSEIYSCKIVNISPGGYCIRWEGKTPGVLRTGELLTLREAGEKSWHIGIIRWVKQTLNSGAEFGVEVLSPRGKPCGAKVLRHGDEPADFMRALILPEMKTLNRPATIITPNLSFKENYRIIIRSGSDEVKAQLSTEVLVTQSFSQFEFTVLQKDKGFASEQTSRAEPKNATDNYDEVWHTL